MLNLSDSLELIELSPKNDEFKPKGDRFVIEEDEEDDGPEEQPEEELGFWREILRTRVLM